MSATWRMHLDAITVHFPHGELHGAASKEVFAEFRQLQSRRLCNGLIKASASTVTAPAAVTAADATPSAHSSISVTSTSSKEETHAHLNKSVITFAACTTS